MDSDVSATKINNASNINDSGNNSYQSDSSSSDSPPPPDEIGMLVSMKNNTTLINSLLASYNFNIYLKNITLVLFGTLLLAISSKVQVPFWPVPMTMQTFIVFIIGMAYGWKLAFSTLIAYLLEGALGLPVFAKGGGLLYLLGPTAGYLYGMTIAAGIIGYFAECGFNKSYFESFISKRKKLI